LRRHRNGERQAPKSQQPEFQHGVPPLAETIEAHSRHGEKPVGIIAKGRERFIS
jgi:hypothetical protein